MGMMVSHQIFLKCLKYFGNIAFVVRAINYAYEYNMLSITHRHKSIACLPKSGKPKHLLKILRLISLLNTVYEILSGSIANGIKEIFK